MAGVIFGVITLAIAAVLWLAGTLQTSGELALTPGERAFVLILAALITVSGVLLIRYGAETHAQRQRSRRERPGNSN